MENLFTSIFYQPVLNLLIFLYNITPFNDFGVAIILLTIAIKLVFWPLGGKAIKAQKALQDLQPKIEEIKKKYADDKVGSSQATMALYKDNKVNPFSSCLPMLIQLPFLWAVFKIFRDGFSSNLDLVYSWIYRPEFINTFSFGFLDLAKANPVLAVMAGLAQFWQVKMMSTKKPEIKTPGSKDENLMATMNQKMIYLMPAVTIFIGMTLPGGLTLYWLTITLLTVLQQVVTFRKKGNDEKPQVIEGEIVN